MLEGVVEELKLYVKFGEVDERALRALHEAAAGKLAGVADVFYQRILGHEEARKVLSEGESHAGRLRITLEAWLESLLSGPWDQAYWEHREAIGRVHVRIGLQQHYMFGAMNVVRAELARIAYASFHHDAQQLETVHEAVGKILDLELAVMLHTYREDLLAQQARVERLSVFGQLVGSIGHDLRNPLSVIATSLDLMRSGAGQDERVVKHVRRISEQVEIANGIVTNLLDMIRDRPLAKERVRITNVVHGAASAVTRPAEVRLETEGLDALPEVDGDPGQLRQVLVNLLENAVHAASPHGSVAVRGRSRDGSVEIDVEDTGPGVDPATRRRLFEPLITTKQNGVGLGLALVKRVAERHGGSVRYSDRAGGGARFTVRLPAAE